MKFLRIVCALLVIGCAAVTVNRLLIPTQNTTATHFDTLIVLGVPANADGTASTTQRERVLEAIREYKAGVAPVMIMSGGAAHNQFVEAHVMAVFAISQGVPASAVIEEGDSLNTIQNIYYSSQIIKTRSWHSAEVISYYSHLGRAALILQAMAKSHPDLAIEWRAHPAPLPVGYGRRRNAIVGSIEAARCLWIRIFGLPRSRFLP